MAAEGTKYTLEQLQAGRMRGACCEHILSLDAIHRIDLFNKLAFERLQRKNNDILEIHRSAGENWNQTFHILLFRVVGGTSNREAFDRLARRVTYHTLMRENSSVESLEALLLGTSGLLELYAEDDYIRRLRKEFDHLRAKYDIVPMTIDEWQLTRIYPHNHPTLRLVQLAACLRDNMLTMQSATSCRKRSDVYRLFAGRASTSWAERFMPTANKMTITRRIGQFKSDLLGINLVAQIIFAYGNYLQSDTLIDNAIALLEDIPAEDNRYINLWNSLERITHSAYDSQALIQLSTEYCLKRGCEECPLATALTRL